MINEKIETLADVLANTLKELEVDINRCSLVDALYETLAEAKA